MMWIRKNLVVILLTVGIILDLGISAVLYLQDQTLRHTQRVQRTEQQASDCWDRVLVVALHDHLTPAQRAALIKTANGCADLTK